MATKIKINKGDTVRIIAGSQKGTEGSVLSINKANNKAIVEGVNLVKKHNKPNAQNPQGGITEKEAPIDISIKLRSLIFPGKPRLKASGFKNAEIATKTAASPTRL